MSLKKIIIQSFIFCILLPYLILSSLLVGYYLEFQKSRKLDIKYSYKVSNIIIDNYYQEITSLKDAIIYSKELTDFVVTYSAIGNFTSNVLYGKVVDIVRSRKDLISLSVLSSANENIFDFTVENPRESLFRLKYTFPIMLDDQGLNSPSSKLQGYVNLEIGTNVLESLLPRNAYIRSIEKNKPTVVIKNEDPWMYSYLPYLLGALGLVMASLALLGLLVVKKNILIPITRMVNELQNKANLSSENRKISGNEILILEKTLEEYEAHIVQTNVKLLQKERDAVFIKMATQVAHDIRSPLELLKSLKQETMHFPEDSRRRIQLSVNRIEEIAYNLLQLQKKKQPLDMGRRSEELWSLVSSLVLEKQMEFRDKSRITIKSKLVGKYGKFSLVSRNSLKNILSNLVNNATEACEGEGFIEIEVKSTELENVISVTDTGAGIPIEIQKKLFQQGCTSKSSGNGLGLFNAKEEIDSLGGRISYISHQDKGTIFTITLPKTLPSKCHIEKLDLSFYKKIIVLDDDPSFHEVWNKKLEEFSGPIEYLFSTSDLLSKYTTIDCGTLLLTDFELMDDMYDGISTIEKLGCMTNSVLVTARSEESTIVDRCLGSNIKLLPKLLLSEIEINQNKDLVILIDDDKFCHINWKLFCVASNIEFRSFFTIEEFLNKSPEISFISRIFIDSNLGGAVAGELESEKIFNYGFRNLYLSTGYNSEDIIKPTWIKQILSKNPEACIYGST